jgi:hypothetical protein
LKNRQGESSVLDQQGVESDGCVVDVSDRHRENVDEEEERVARVDPGDEKRNMMSPESPRHGGRKVIHFWSALTRSVLMNERSSCIG